MLKWIGKMIDASKEPAIEKAGRDGTLGWPAEKQSLERDRQALEKAGAPPGEVDKIMEKEYQEAWKNQTNKK